MWISREKNELADYYSRIKDTNNWSIDNDSFSLLTTCTGHLLLTDLQTT